MLLTERNETIGHANNHLQPAILTVEDASGAQRWISSLAQTAFPGKKNIVARSLRDLTMLMARHTFELALVDLQLRDGSGVEIIRHITRSRPETQCIVVTLLDDDEHIFSSLAAGATGYLLKNQPWQALLDGVLKLAHGVPALSPTVTRRLIEYCSRTVRPAPSYGDDNHLALSRREKEVLTLLARGQHIADVANSLHLSAHTVCSHIKNIYRKLDVTTRAEAALAARQMGLV